VRQREALGVVLEVVEKQHVDVDRTRAVANVAGLPGEDAPALALDRLGGDGEVSLASFRGKAVVVNFWASWCEPCEEESPRLEAAWQRYRDDGVVVLGVDAHDFRSEAADFVERFELTYPMAHDGPGRTLRAFGIAGFPETLFVDRAGRIVEWVQGPVSDEELARGIARALEQPA
jgi:cytochrome c biogenesis protein CcmG/thiol:disulfide interchange protein DsbE